MRLADFASMFRNPQEDLEAEAWAEARQILDWMNQDYHAKFEKWLDDQASKPFEIGPKLVESAMRVNTLREVQKHLHRLRNEAMAARQRMQTEG